VQQQRQHQPDGDAPCENSVALLELHRHYAGARAAVEKQRVDALLWIERQRARMMAQLEAAEEERQVKDEFLRAAESDYEALRAAIAQGGAGGGASGGGGFQQQQQAASADGRAATALPRRVHGCGRGVGVSGQPPFAADEPLALTTFAALRGQERQQRRLRESTSLPTLGSSTATARAGRSVGGGTRRTPAGGAPRRLAGSCRGARPQTSAGSSVISGSSSRLRNRAGNGAVAPEQPLLERKRASSGTLPRASRLGF